LSSSPPLYIDFFLLIRKIFLFETFFGHLLPLAAGCDDKMRLAEEKKTATKVFIN